MPAQFLLNLCIAFLWVFLQDEDTFSFYTLSVGYLVGVVIVFLMHRFFGKPFYLRRFYAAMKLVGIFISELFQSSYFVIKYILNPRREMEPGIFKYETKLAGEWEVPLLAMLLTLTPGSVVMEVTPAGNVFFIHAMDLASSKETLIRSLSRFEAAIMEVTR